MKKAWKGYANDSGSVRPSKQGGYCAPVLVIDASDFPEGYPEIDSEWTYTNTMGKDYTATVRGYPIMDTIDEWRVVVQYSGSTVTVPISSLSPIPEEPKTAKGEVVATVLVEDGAIKSFTLPDDGTYDIIKRGDK